MKKNLTLAALVMVILCTLFVGNKVCAEDLVSSTILGLNTEMSYISMTNDEQTNYYKISLQQAGEVKLTVTNANNVAQTTNPRICVYDEMFNITYQDFSIESIGVPNTVEKTMYLYAGTYYIQINANGYKNYRVGVSVKYTAVNEPISSTIENPAGAISVNYNQEYTGLLEENAHFNYYKIDVPVKSKVSVTSYQNCDLVFCFMQSNAYDEITRNQFESPSGTDTVELEAGTYYLRFGGNGLFYTSNRCIYKFKVTLITSVTAISVIDSKTITAGKTVLLSAIVTPDNATDKSVTWKTNNSNVATVDENGFVKGINAGSAKITVVSNDNKEIYAECKVIVKPKRPSIGKFSVSKAKGKKRHVFFSIKSSTTYSGYQMQWGKTKKLKNKKTSNLYYVDMKKGTYYFRVRSYIEVDGMKYYSEWSKVKKKRIK